MMTPAGCLLEEVSVNSADILSDHGLTVLVHLPVTVSHAAAANVWCVGGVESTAIICETHSCRVRCVNWSLDDADIDS